jgi:hypothetical protein
MKIVYKSDKKELAETHINLGCASSIWFLDTHKTGFSQTDQQKDGQDRPLHQASSPAYRRDRWLYIRLSSFYSDDDLDNSDPVMRKWWRFDQVVIIN